MESTMKTTSHQPAPLERHQSNARIDTRMALRRLRVGLHRVITCEQGQRTPEPAHPWHDLTREEPRSALPCEKERTMLHAAIRQGCTTPERVIEYRMLQLADDLAQFAQPAELSEILYIQMMAEQAEAFAAQSRAHALPSPAHTEAAIRETEEANVVQRAYVTLMRHGRSLFHAGL
jgi:hypothetical protein